MVYRALSCDDIKLLAQVNDIDCSYDGATVALRLKPASAAR